MSRKCWCFASQEGAVFDVSVILSSGESRVNVSMSGPVRSEQFSGSLWLILAAHDFSFRQNKWKTEPFVNILSSAAHSFDISLCHLVIICKSLVLLGGKWGLSSYCNEVMLAQLHTERANWGQQRFVHLRNCRSSSCHSVLRLCVYYGIKTYYNSDPSWWREKLMQPIWYHCS